jgi:hypothetical protein
MDKLPAAVDEAVEHVDELFHIGHVQAHGGFAQHLQGVRYFSPAFGDVVRHIERLDHPPLHPEPIGPKAFVMLNALA